VAKMGNGKTGLETFQEWFKSQTKYKTQKEFAKATGIPRSSVSFYIQGVRKPLEEHSKILYEVTGLDCFKSVIKIPEKKEVEKKVISKETGVPLHIQLQNWFKSQTKWKSYAEIGKATGIDPSDVSKYIRGVKMPGKKVLQKLSIVVDVDVLRKEAKIKGEGKEEISTKTLEKFEVKKEPDDLKTPFDMQEKVGELQKIVSDLSEKIDSFDGLCEKCIASKLPNSTEESSVKERVEIVKELLYALNSELEFFKKESPESREMFRKKIHAPDVGYIIALLRALFDEDKFQSWLYMSDYRMNRR